MGICSYLYPLRAKGQEANKQRWTGVSILERRLHQCPCEIPLCDKWHHWLYYNVSLMDVVTSHSSKVHCLIIAVYYHECHPENDGWFPIAIPPLAASSQTWIPFQRRTLRMLRRITLWCIGIAPLCPRLKIIVNSSSTSTGPLVNWQAKVFQNN